MSSSSLLLPYPSFAAGSLVRKNVDSLSEQEILTLQTVLKKLEDDNTEHGFQALAAYHGEPSQCHMKDGQLIACCIHGMPTFPHWHRAYVVQFEQALVEKGLANIGVPYWDWTQPISALPELVRHQIYRDPTGGVGQKNSWFSADIEHGDVHTHTARAVDDRLYEHVAPGGKTHLFSMMLDALEQDEYCHFEAQFEVAHNHIHYLVGGRHHYSMSTLEYTSYDPIFFLHHSNVDRLFVIWQELQKKRGKPYDHSDCGVELFNKPLEPFNSDNNPIELTKTFNKPKDLFSHLQLGYTYDDLTLNGMSINELHSLLEHRRSRDRYFAAFSLHGLGFSAECRVQVCHVRDEEEDHCEDAGDFFILGGANEMPWEFTVPYYYDIGDAMEKLKQSYGEHDHYVVHAELHSVNGTQLGSDLLGLVYISHRPAHGFTDPVIHDGRKSTTVVRKDVDVLTDEEVYYLRQAMARFQNDTSIDGYQAVAEFHGLPAKCPHPDAAVRYACCLHGMPTFPHWHRLFVTEVEDELRSRGLQIGIPYWDWTRPNTHIPALANDETYEDPHTHQTLHNPFHDADVAFIGEKTTRQVQDELSETPEFGDHTALFDAMLLAFEQTDYCDFEVQFEVTHNAIHFLVGGYGPYTLATLHYSAFDPIFFLHHSNVDRQWAIWQQLQMKRGLPYKAHCAGSMTEEVLKPFGFPPPYHNDAKIHDNARPDKIYDYESVLDYTYDSLQFGGMTIDQLDHYLEERKSKDRTFVGIMLHNIGISAWATLSIEMASGDHHIVAKLAVLGGEKEMPWRFDRAFKVEITDALHKLGLSYDDEFHVHLDIVDVTGKKWPEDTFSHETIIHMPAETHHEDDFQKDEHVRSDVEHLTVEQMQNLREALKAVKEDNSISGFNQIASFHGQPNWCPSPQAEHKLACCAHGMPVFPHWHRLLTVQAENALMDRGMHSGLPYWDWTLPMTHLPDLVKDATYLNPKTGETEPNPWFCGEVNGHMTSRSVREELFAQPEFGHLTPLAEQVMLAFEQDNFCDFELQYEIAHNYIHAVVGGNEEYSMASLRFTAFDPIFYLHHSNTDRIWAIWQHLQKYRGKPYNSANCAIAEMRKPLQPFAQTSVTNPDAVTRDHSVPFDVFNYHSSFHYEYDNFQFNGMSIPQLQRETVRRTGLERSFAGFMLHGIKKSSLVVFDICKPDNTCKKAGEFYLLGDEYEIPWEYDRLYKYEITKQLADFGLDHHDRFDIRYSVSDLEGNNLGSHVFGNVSTVYSPGLGHMKGHTEDYLKEVRASSHVRRDIDTLTMGERESLKSALKDMEEDGSFEQIAKFHGYPGLCQHDGHAAACCVHGAPTFPHWHRLYVENVENALLNHGSAISMPYWDWTKPIEKLPDLVRNPTYYDSRTHKKEVNPFFRWKVPGKDAVYTTRDPLPELFDSHYFLDNVLLALEQTSFCDFEVQFEIVHNALHSFVGGRGKHSMATLDYTAFDPVFFLHHANVDRIWAIWQALQKFRGLAFDDTDCAMNLMSKPLHPFDDQDINDCHVTYKYSRPADVFDYSHHFDYHYDTLEFNSWSIPQLEEVLKKQRSRDRLFAGFLLHNIGTSAEVEIDVCVHTGAGTKSCNHPAGKFTILGGEYEMPFTFDRLYKYDISDTVRKLGLRLDSAADFDVEAKVRAYNGSYIDPSVLGKPTIVFQPGEGKTQDDEGHTHRHLARKNVWSLSPAERRSLVLAMKGLQADSSADGFQSLASFHALPPLCPYPEAPKRYACCIHGMATFPQWHRLYTVQFEDALRRHGALVGIPYWDTVSPQRKLPPFINDEVWDDPLFHANFSNPWHGADIEFKHQKVARDVNMEQLGKKGPKGYDTWSWKQYVFALEQENYCDFEVQFEIAHNAIHAWMGGSEEFSMGHLHYASYDPVFILHHSFTDRVFAIWQELQKFRGHDPNEVNCALEMMREPLKPFSFGAPYNLNSATKEYSKPEDAFDYQGHFHYDYDHLELQGMNVRRLQDYINKQKERDRVFAGFLLSGIGTSAHVDFDICKTEGGCTHAGDFDILGGSMEMPWRFDRLYKYEITDVLHSQGLDVHDTFAIQVTITEWNGTALSSSLLPSPSVLLEPKSRDIDLHEVAPNRVRHDLTHLTERDVQSLKSAIRELQNDNSTDGYQNIASFHGAPGMCPDATGNKIACCIHGMPTFPHWHRLYTVEMEDALIRHGSGVALPYWDWTMPIKHLPEMFTSEDYYDAWRDEVIPNPFVRAYIDHSHGYTVREPQPELNKLSKDGKHSVLFDEVLLALEQTDYCDFEVQFEVLHNAIHYLVGGHQIYSLSSLEYSSYDPIFFVHHTMVDKIWAVWQELQKKRGLVYDRADCAVNYMNEKMHPFDWEDFNPDVRTREHSVPQTVFDYEDLGYHYDNFELGGKTLDELEELIHEQQSHPRVFAGFHLHGIYTSAAVRFFVCRSESSCVRAGGIFILGGKLEMPWSFDRLYKYDITDVLHDIGIEPDDVFNPQAPFFLKYEIKAVNGTSMPLSSVSEPTLIYQPAKGAAEDQASYTIAGVGVRKNINTLTEAEIENLRDALRRVKAGTGRVSYDMVVKAHGYPPQCELDGHAVACCHHGSASFPQWHRVFVRQMEAALTWEGAKLGIPYWPWEEAFTELPRLIAEEHDNPFHHGHVPGSDKITTRAPRPQLFKDPEHGEESFFYRQVMLALEQRDYCDFEVQFEVIHNAIHSWIGGTSPYGMSTLEYSAYDPVFFIHHSNVDRQFAIWQALQKYRGLDYNTANCNIQELRQPLEPFNHEDNPVQETRDHSRAIDAFNYDALNYQYDNLNFHGLTIPQLDHLLEEKKAQDRVFLNFMLHGFKSSADVEFELCDAHDTCNFAGTFAVLGGPLEMPWSFDRLFKYDVTSVFRQMRLRPDSDYHFKLHIVAVNGTELNPNILEAPSVSFVPGRKSGSKAAHAHEEPTATESDELTRYEVSALSLAQVSNLRNALYKLQNDHGPNGFEAIASFHGAPGRCPENASDHYACCQHGMPAFPHWHRLLTIQFEHALKEKGAVVGVPYWDWTRPAKSLPSLFTDASDSNPFKTYHITHNNKDVERGVQDYLFQHSGESDPESLFHQALEMLEETNYCDFEVQYEMLHNAVHELVGGNHTYGMSTLDYSAFDPFFMVHHASIDRLWQIWQQLQKLRHKPFNYASCASRMLYRPLEPFHYESVNTDPLTRNNAQPVQLFDTHKFHYHYDNMLLNGHDLHELEEMIHTMQAQTRIFAGFVLFGFKTSAHVHVDVVKDGEVANVGNFFVLGGPTEMPWAYERIYKMDMTEAANKLGLSGSSHFDFKLTVTKYDGTPMNVEFPAPVIVKRRANMESDEVILSMKADNKLPPKIVVRRGTRVVFHATDEEFHGPMRELGSYTNNVHCAIPPGDAHAYAMDVPHELKPGDYYFTANDKEQCKNGATIQISVDDE
ncbi:hemocyanin 2-like isoform X2 [Babylonia areolata]|uniref:hemocyanin 2-like isoform X2 n=1 Tax=Babylonia areolata TaxID=304850 RepID=UPI003FD1BC9C